MRMETDPAQTAPLIGVIMGSKSDWATLQSAVDILNQFEAPHECLVVSAHRTPEWMAEYASTAASRGLEVIIAGAGGAARDLLEVSMFQVNLDLY